MRLITFVLASLYSTAVVAGPQKKAKRSDTSSFDITAAWSQAAVLTSLFSAPSATATLAFQTPGGNLLQPPASLVGAIISAIPASVLVDLAQATPRSSIASEFRAGNTPAWYATLPADIKSYVEALASQVNKGEVNLSATPTPVKWAGTSSDTPTKTGEDAAAVTSKKSRGGAAKPTQAPLGAGIAAAVGLAAAVLVL